MQFLFQVIHRFLLLFDDNCQCQLFNAVDNFCVVTNISCGLYRDRPSRCNLFPALPVATIDTPSICVKDTFQLSSAKQYLPAALSKDSLFHQGVRCDSASSLGPGLRFPEMRYPSAPLQNGVPKDGSQDRQRSAELHRRPQRSHLRLTDGASSKISLRLPSSLFGPFRI